jgi:hypothetical protein
LGDVAIPGFQVEGLARVRFLVQLGHHHLLGDDVPAGPGRVELAQEPALLVRPGHGGFFVAGYSVARCRAIAVGEGAIRTGVEHAELREVSVGDPAVEPPVWTARVGEASQGHVLVVGLKDGA